MPLPRRLLLVSAALLLAAGAAYVAWRHYAASDLPAGFAVGNGRIEAERVDIATKFSGRLREVLADEGDWVERGAVLARLDSADVEAQLREAKAAVEQARQRLSQAAAAVAQRESQLRLAEIELQRAQLLLRKNNVAKQVVDERTAQRDLQAAGLDNDRAAVGDATAAIEAAIARAERLQVDLEEYTLTAPRSGRIQYRLAQPGEMLAAGGRVLTLLDLTDVYMEIFLPTVEIGRLPIGAAARIVLDAAPQYVFPASVSFVAADAQFTPRQVETARERENLMFRVKVQVPEELLERYARLVKTGLPGVAYVQLDAQVAWPERLTVHLPDAG
ncbi:MAG: HlyD family efflux transporter periplasmic adaptor subunit [Geminicoccaceae bacterium]